MASYMITVSGEMANRRGYRSDTLNQSAANGLYRNNQPRMSGIGHERTYMDIGAERSFDRKMQPNAVRFSSMLWNDRGYIHRLGIYFR